MFKKEPQPKASANIKSSDRRKLLGEICKTYGLSQENLSKEDELKLVPYPIKQANFASVQGYKGSIFFDEHETPLWFKSRDSNLFPSVFTTWRYPTLLPVVKTHPHVIEVIKNGADLMLPGTIPPFDKREVKGAIVGVVDSEHPSVVKAVGRCKLNLTQFDEVLGRTGIAVGILHHIFDHLFNLNDSRNDNTVPDVIEDIGNAEEKKEDTKEEHHDQTGVIEEAETTNQSTFDSEDIAEELSELKVDEVDNFFVRSLIQSIIQDTFELPEVSSLFMSNHIYKNLPVMDAKFCNIKKTSWKKSAKFLKAMEKRGFLQAKGKDDNLSVVSLKSKESPEFANFVHHRTMGSLQKAPDQSAANNKNRKTEELSIVKLYKPTKKAKAFFEKVGENAEFLYTAPELRSLIEKYSKLQDIVDRSAPRNLIMTDALVALTNLQLGSRPRDVIFKAALANCSSLYKILKPGQSIDDDSAQLHKGEPPIIKIITEMKIGRKVITRVNNFEAFYVKPLVLADELKVKCSGSTTVGSCVQNPKLAEVSVQGPHGKLLINLLNSKGIPMGCISFEDRTKKKKSS